MRSSAPSREPIAAQSTSPLLRRASLRSARAGVTSASAVYRLSSVESLVRHDYLPVVAADAPVTAIASAGSTATSPPVADALLSSTPWGACVIAGNVAMACVRRRSGTGQLSGDGGDERQITGAVAAAVRVIALTGVE